jgi:hypothetical protein
MPVAGYPLLADSSPSGACHHQGSARTWKVRAGPIGTSEPAVTSSNTAPQQNDRSLILDFLAFLQAKSGCSYQSPRNSQVWERRNTTRITMIGSSDTAGFMAECEVVFGGAEPVGMKQQNPRYPHQKSCPHERIIQ